MHNDGVDRVLHFMGHARGEPPDSGKPARELDFIFDPVHRFGVAQREQGPDALAIFLNEIEGNLDEAAVLSFNFFLAQGLARADGRENGASAGESSEKISEGWHPNMALR